MPYYELHFRTSITQGALDHLGLYGRARRVRFISRMVLFWMSASILKGDSDPEDSLREFILQSPALNHELTEADRTALLSIQAVTKVHRQRSRHV